MGEGTGLGKRCRGRWRIGGRWWMEGMVEDGGREMQGRKVEDGGAWWRMGEGGGEVEDGGEVDNGGKVEDVRVKDGGRWEEVEVHLKESQLTT